METFHWIWMHRVLMGPCYMVSLQESKLYGAHFKEITADAPKSKKITFNDSDEDWLGKFSQIFKGAEARIES